MPFLHITTRITDHPYDSLLREKGFGGFPSLAFMDADGEVLGQPKDRSVESFAATADALVRIKAVAADAAAKKPHAATELLLLEYALGRVNDDEFLARADALGDDPSVAQAATISQTRVDVEAWGFIMEGYQGDAEAGLAGLLQMHADGRIPSPGGRQAMNFWTMIGDSAKDSGDAALLRKVAAGIRTSFPDGDEYMSDAAKRYEETAKGLDERDALAKRKAAGEAGLEAKILLVEGRLRATTFESFSGRLADALKVATEAEATELRQLERDIEVDGLVDQYWGGGDRGKVSARLVELATSLSPAPSDTTMRLAFGPLYNWAMGQDDADALERHADAMAARGGEGSTLADIAESFREIAAKKREEG
ncbi:MAG: hypothetical protein P1V81_04730 [Planctomycetota bacterium]|nr:hypothetical protein [Planctomycetota bacterium]